MSVSVRKAENDRKSFPSYAPSAYAPQKQAAEHLANVIKDPDSEEHSGTCVSPYLSGKGLKHDIWTIFINI